MTVVLFGWRATRRIALYATMLAMSTACGTSTPLDQLSEAKRLSAELLIQFTKAADAGNRAVMADTDDASMAFAKEAETSKAAVQTSVEKLRSLLQQLGYGEEGRLLQEFDNRFAEYRELDRMILKLAVENTNLKAQRLSFGEAQGAADAFTKSLEWSPRRRLARCGTSARSLPALSRRFAIFRWRRRRTSPKRTRP